MGLRANTSAHADTQQQVVLRGSCCVPLVQTFDGMNTATRYLAVVLALGFAWLASLSSCRQLLGSGKSHTYFLVRLWLAACLAAGSPGTSVQALTLTERASPKVMMAIAFLVSKWRLTMQPNLSDDSDPKVGRVFAAQVGGPVIFTLMTAS